MIGGLTESLPLSCMPFARRDSDLERLSISSMIPWMWSPEIPWKSMAPGPGRNVQLPGSVLQPTTSIYRTAAQRPRSLSTSEWAQRSSKTEAHHNQPQKSPQIESSSSDRRKTGRWGGEGVEEDYSMGGTGVMGLHQSLSCSSRECPAE